MAQIRKMEFLKLIKHLLDLFDLFTPLFCLIASCYIILSFSVFAQIFDDDIYRFFNKIYISYICIDVLTYFWFTFLFNNTQCKTFKIFTTVYSCFSLCLALYMYKFTFTQNSFFLFWKPRSYKCPSWLIAVVMLWSQGLLYHCTWWPFLAFQL